MSSRFGGVAKIEPTEETPILVFTFRAAINENLTVKYQIVKLHGSCLIWVGTGSAPKFSDLALAMKSSGESEPVASKILGGLSDSPSVSLACRLSKKLDKPVYVSFNVAGDRTVMNDIEKRLFDEIDNRRGVF